MKYPMYCIRDIKATDFGIPVIDINDETAKRSFAIRLHNDNSLSFRPSDYELYSIGEYDTETGHIESCFPEFICTGDEVF